MIDITPADQEIVTAILKKHVPHAEVRVFGSRHKWTAKPYSDLDLAIVADAKLDKQLIYDLEEAFEESELSFRVDVIDWFAISDEFRAIIEQGYTVIQEKTRTLPAGWVVKKLGDVVDLSQGLAINAKTKHLLSNEGLPLLRITDLINNSATHFIIEELAPKKCIIYSGDVIYTRTGQVGLVFNNRNGVLHNNSFKVSPINDKLNKEYLFWFLRQERINQLANNMASGSVQKDLNHSAFKSIEIAIPPIEEQKEIAAILSSLDDKIELNQQINKKLEEMAQAIFKEWFINFNFPDENGNPYRDSGGAMIDSELGQIPASWSIGKLGDYVNIVGGATPSTKNTIFWENGTIYWATPKDLSVNTDVFLKNTLRKITTEGLKEISSGLLPPKTLLLSSRAPIGYLSLSNISLAINQGYIAILPTSKYDNAFLYVWLKNNMDKVLAMANGSTFQEISKKSFKRIAIVNYPIKLIDKYLEITSQLFEQINLLEVEIINLQNTRDTLLPKLMSGKQ